MRLSISIGKKDEFLKYGKRCPKWYPCPCCGQKGRRKTTYERLWRDIALGQESYVVVRIGVYKARCKCQRYFVSECPEISPKGAQYTWGVRDMVIESILRDRMSISRVKKRLEEDFLINLSPSTIWTWMEKEASRFRLDQHWFPTVRQHFSGLLCIDEVHEPDYAIFIATDPLSDLRITFQMVKDVTQETFAAFCDHILNEVGIVPQVVITDGLNIYPDVLEAKFGEASHQLCVFHVLQDINRIILKAMAAERRKIKERHYARGRPVKKGRPRKGKTAHKGFAFKHRHILLKKKENLTSEDRKYLKELFRICPSLKPLAGFVQNIYRLFAPHITKQVARNRWRRIQNNAVYQKNPYLAKALKKLEHRKFEKMIDVLGRKDNQRTNNHVERANREFRMTQKTRYKRRITSTVANALKLAFVRQLKDTSPKLFIKAFALARGYYAHVA